MQIARDIESINFNCVRANISNKHLVHHLVLIENEQPGTNNEAINELLIRFWEKGLLNALIIFHRQNEVQIASFDPFATNKFSYFRSNGTEHQSSLFPDKTANLNGYTLKATIFQDVTRATFNQSNRRDVDALRGTDGRLTQLIVQYMNASVELLSPTDGVEIGEFLGPGRASGCLGMLVRGEADFGVNMRFYRLGQFKTSVEATTTTGRDDICILAPRTGFWNSILVCLIFHCFIHFHKQAKLLISVTSFEHLAHMIGLPLQLRGQRSRSPIELWTSCSLVAIISRVKH